MMKLNKKAFDHAKDLIGNYRYVKESDWSEAQPSAKDENEFLDGHGWDEFEAWYLGIEEDENKKTKKHFAFPYGDFRRLHRSGLIAIKQRAAQNDYEEIREAADYLLDKFEEKSS